MTSKSKSAFLKRLLVASLIDSGLGKVPLLVDATGMGRRTVQEIINTLDDIGISCLRTGSTKSGYYYIADWGFFDKKEIKTHLQHINDVLECLMNEQLVLEFVEGIPMSDQRLMQAMFNQQRYQILSLGVHHNVFDDGYLYAWESGIYPLFSETDGSVNPMPHEIYPEFFTVKLDTVQSVLNYLDNKWVKDESPTFYELEDHFGGKWSEESGRVALIKICRYAYLSHRFDQNLFDKLLTPMQHPSEASSIRRPLNRGQDIYFM